MAQEIVPVWGKVDPGLTAELARFWIDNKAMVDESKAAERAAQVVCVARLDGRLVGATTAYPRIVPMLRQPMYYLRMYLAPDVRGSEMSWRFLNDSFATIEKQELGKDKPLCLGVILSIENHRLARHYNQAYWPRTKFVYAGISRDGQDLRVRYFEDVRLPPPVQLKAKAAAAKAKAPAA